MTGAKIESGSSGVLFTVVGVSIVTRGLRWDALAAVGHLEGTFYI